MKLKYLFNIVCLLFITSSYSQDQLHLKNGKVLNGTVKSILKGKVTFKIGKKNKNYTSKVVSKVIDRDENGTIEYTYRKIKGVPENSLSGEIVSGKASLYITYFHVYGSGKDVHGTYQTGYGQQVYYLHIKGKEKALKILPGSLVTPFYKRVSKYISDCDNLSLTVKNKELHYNDMPEITKKYNSSCSN